MIYVTYWTENQNIGRVLSHYFQNFYVIFNYKKNVRFNKNLDLMYEYNLCCCLNVKSIWKNI